VLLNKADLGDLDKMATTLGALPVSAMTGTGVRESLHAIVDLVEEAERVAPERKGFVLHRPLGPTFTVRREEGAWRVDGIAAERAVGFADLTMAEAADMASWRLARLGVDQALREAGAVEGDEVRIGDVSFEFVPDPGEEE
jgi:GTP-binding protein